MKYFVGFMVSTNRADPALPVSKSGMYKVLAVDEVAARGLIVHEALGQGHSVDALVLTEITIEELTKACEHCGILKARMDTALKEHRAEQADFARTVEMEHCVHTPGATDGSPIIIRHPHKPRVTIDGTAEPVN